jgi:hypothetical protein
MLCCYSQKISFFHVEIKLEVVRNTIPKVDFAIALTRAENDLNDFFKSFNKNIRNIQCL